MTEIPAVSSIGQCPRAATMLVVIVPAEWLPPNRPFHCTYVRLWQRVKAIWDVTMDRPEDTVIERVRVVAHLERRRTRASLRPAAMCRQAGQDLTSTLSPLRLSP